MAGNITVRLWSQEELRKIRTGADDYLATVLMNGQTFSAQTIASYPYNRRKTYWVAFSDGSEVRCYATDDQNLRKYLQAQYHYNMIVAISEAVTEYREVAV